MKKMQLSIALAAAMFALSACNDEGSGDSSNSASNNGEGGEQITSMEELAGVYDQSTESDDGVIEINYLSIDSNGEMTNYLYTTDESDSADGCYTASNNFDTLTHVSGNQFESTFLGPFTASKNGNIVTTHFTIISVPMLKAELTLADLLGNLCSDASSDEETPSTDTTINSLEDIIGIFAWSIAYPDDNAVDEKYLKINEDGSVIEYDYLADSHDLGDNCYDVDESFEQITHITGNQFSGEKFKDFTITIDDEGKYLLSNGSNLNEKLTKSDLLESDFTAAICEE